MKIIDYLHITIEEYNDLLFETYLKWCAKMSQNDYDLQQLLANAKMYKWFLFNINGLEQEFMEDALPYLELKNSQAMVELWKKHTMKIYYYYSVPLINVARKTTIINIIQPHDLNSLRN
jgi:hypothetical protein